MLDYYKILGIPRSADHQTIKSAYKRLALKYHPDRNPSNKAAEEYFKVVNEAHQTLVDPEKKAQYDLLLNYAYEYEYERAAQATTVPPQKPRTYRPPQERSYYERYGKFNWRSGPRYKTAPPYKIDKSYFKIQLFTLIAVVIITLFCVAVFKVNQYLEAQKAEELRLKNEKILAQAHQLYNEGQYRMALNIVIDLAHNNPIENRFSNEKEIMVAGLNSKAIALYKNAEYDKAVEKLEIVRDYESPMRLQTWRMIADCNYQLKNYKKAIHALKYILMRDKNNIDLIIRIGDIYYDDLGMIDQALDYYTEAKYMFKEFQSASYGKAFELLMPVERVPKLYFDMFTKRGEINMAAHNYAEAITDYNWAIFLRPNEAKPYHLRALCQEKTGNINRACSDWRRAATLGYQESSRWIQKYCR